MLTLARSMNGSNFLDWMVALVICWAGLTAVYQPSGGSAGCDVQSSTSIQPPSLSTHRPDLQSTEIIRDMMLHD